MAAGDGQLYVISAWKVKLNKLQPGSTASHTMRQDLSSSLSSSSSSSSRSMGSMSFMLCRSLLQHSSTSSVPFFLVFVFCFNPPLFQTPPLSGKTGSLDQAYCAQSLNVCVTVDCEERRTWYRLLGMCSNDSGVGYWLALGAL